jgi:general secretion pathway protein K
MPPCSKPLIAKFRVEPGQPHMEIRVRRETANEQRGDGGFALVLTLVVILALSLLTEVMTRWVSSALENAFASRRDVEIERQMAEVRAISAYLMTMRPLSLRGVELQTIAQLRSPIGASPVEPVQLGETYIRLDDQPYRLGDLVLRFQDTRGLINPNLGSSDDLFALLGIFGVASEDRGPLIAKLQDYIDADSLTRLNGAEAPQYEEAGRDPPANAPLRTPWEVRRILDWDGVKEIAAEDTRWSLLTSTEPVVGFNVNTAPRVLLSLMPWMTEEAVDNIISWRGAQPITSSWQFGLLTGIRMPEGPSLFAPAPSDSVILTVSAKDRPLERRIALRMTSLSPDRPWTIDYDLDMPRAARDGKQSDPDDFPLSALLSPDS